MKTIFIGILVLSLFAAVASKLSNPSIDDLSPFNKFLISTGLKKKEDFVNKDLINQLTLFSAKNDQFQKYLISQNEYLSSSKQEVEGLSSYVAKQSSKENGLDLLKLKNLINQLESQTSLLVTDGERLLKISEDKKAYYSKLMRNYKINQIIGSYKKDEILNKINNDFKFQQDKIDDQKTKIEDIKEKIRNINDELKDKQVQLNKDNKTNLREKMDELNMKNEYLLESIKNNQDQLKELMNANKQRMNDLREKTDTALERQRQAQENVKQLNEQIKDRMQSLKDSRNR